MASLRSNINRPAEKPSPSIQKNDLPGRVRLHGLKCKRQTAEQVNGHAVFLDEINDFVTQYNFIKAAKASTKRFTPKTNLTSFITEILDEAKEWAKQFDQVIQLHTMYPIEAKKPKKKKSGIHDPSLLLNILKDDLEEEFDNEYVTVACNWLDIDTGACYYFYQDIYKHTREIRKVLVSAFYLLKQMQISFPEDTQAYESFCNEWDAKENDNGEFEETDEDLWEQLHDRFDPDDAMKLIGEINLYKRKPWKVKFHKQLFKKYSKQDNDLGRWLRLLDEYKDFKIGEYIPIQLVESNSDTQGISFFEGHCVLYRRDDNFWYDFSDFTDSMYKEGGALQCADYSVYTQEKCVKKMRMQGGDLEKIATDINDIWDFNIKNLKFDGYYKRNKKEGRINFNKW